MTRSHLALAGAAALSMAGCTQPVMLAGTMAGSQEVPAVTSAGGGTVTAMVWPSTGAMTYEVTYSNLSGAASAGHFHGPAAPGTNAGVVAPWASLPSPIKGGANLTEAQVADVMAGRWYANLHTAAHPGGEIRGQLLPGVLPK